MAKETTLETQIALILANQQRMEGHLKVYRDNQITQNENIKELKESIIGNELNGKKGFLTDIIELKQKNIKIDEVLDKHSETLKEHKPVVNSVKYFYGVIFVALIGFIIRYFSEKN